MTPKMRAAREAAFLRALAGCGNVSLAAERVELDRSWVKARRRAERRFLAALAASCNVQAALAEVGLSQGSAYARRERWPGFAARWDAALKLGVVRLEAEVVRAASSVGDDEVDMAADGDLAIPPPSFEQALHLLRMHRWRAGDGRRRERKALADARRSMAAKTSWAALDPIARSERLEGLRAGREW